MDVPLTGPVMRVFAQCIDGDSRLGPAPEQSGAGLFCGSPGGQGGPRGWSQVGGRCRVAGCARGASSMPS